MKLAQFVTYFEYCRKLRFDENPNYNYLTGLLVEILGIKFIDSIIYDWKQIKKKLHENEEKKKKNMFKIW